MRTLFESFGTVPVLTAVLLLQLFILHAIVSGRIVRIVRLLVLTPFLVLIFFLFFAKPNLLNHRAEKLETGDTQNAPLTLEEPAAVEEMTAEPFASDKSNKKKQSAAIGSGALPPSDEELATAAAAVRVESEEDFVDVSTRPTDSERAALFRAASDDSVKPVPISGGSQATASRRPAENGSNDTRIGEGAYAGAAKSLAVPPVPYTGSGATLSSSGIRSAEFNASDAREGQSAIPAGFETGAVKIPSLMITPDRIELSDENSRNLMDYLSRTVRQRVEETRPAVVHIEATVMKEGVGGKKASVETGGGVIVKTGRGDYYVITNNHVAGSAVSTGEVRIVLHDHRVLHPTNVLPCPEFDLALLPLAEKDLKAAPLGDSDKVKMIDPVFAVGSPFGLEGSISSGIISGTKRRDLPIGKEKGQFQNFLQTDAAINPGNSGGPLLNTRGQVIGIVTVIATKSGANEGVGLAIPINHVKYVAGRLIRDGVYRRPFIGLDLDREFTAERKAALGLRRSAIDGTAGEEGDQFVGARILGIKPDSPAARAGLKEGDVIIAYNGNVVEDCEHFNHLIGLSAVDETPAIDILRGSEQLRVSPKLTAAR